MVLLLSPGANDSSFVKNEVNRAFSKGKPIFTFRVEDVLPAKALAFYLARSQWSDAFPPPIEKKVARLADALRALDGERPNLDRQWTSVPRQARRHLLKRLIGGGIGLVAISVVLAAILIRGDRDQTIEEPPDPVVQGPRAAPPLDPQDIRRSTIDSTLLIVSERGGGIASCGGALVGNRGAVVVTSSRIVEKDGSITCYFPSYPSGNSHDPLKGIDRYLQNKSKLAIPGKVIWQNVEKQLAVIELVFPDRLPNESRPINLAAVSPKVGQKVHTVSHDGPEEIRGWRWTAGEVLFVLPPQDEPNASHKFSVSNTIGLGAIGGPIVNEHGELVGLLFGTRSDLPNSSLGLDVIEIRAELNKAFGKAYGRPFE
jgi:hypothetical protein